MLLKSPIGQMVARRRARAGVPTRRVTSDEFRALSILGEPQGIAAVVRQRVDALPRRAASGLWVAVERSRSPGNLGTMIRSLAAAGATGLIALGTDPDPFDPRCVRASMGALFHTSFVRTDPMAFAAWKRRARVQIVGADAAAAVDYHRARYAPATVLMIGGERRGLSESQRALCDAFVRIPMASGIDSLNVAVATALLLYEASRSQRGRATRARRAR